MKRLILIGAVGLAVALAGYIRLAPLEAAVWHVPLTGAETTGRPNEAHLVQDIAIAPAILAADLRKVALSEPRTVVLAGEGLHVTYVQRSLWMGYPDIITVQVTPLESGSARLQIWSRARFGTSDFGVNDARIARWMAALGR